MMGAGDWFQLATFVVTALGGVSAIIYRLARLEAAVTGLGDDLKQAHARIEKHEAANKAHFDRLWEAIKELQSEH